MRIRIDLAYDGAPFHGFQKQPDPDLPTVQGTLDDALTKLLGVEPATTCAGRTDAGVHALAQVVHLDVDTGRRRGAVFAEDLDATRHRLDSMTGPAITIWSVTSVDDDFHARFSATRRSYHYRLVDAVPASPLRRHSAWLVGHPLDDAAMRDGARHLRGEHDFAAFCRRAPGRHTVRRIDRLDVERRDDGMLDIALEGPAFCHQQVRSIVGCLVHVGRGKEPPDWIAEVLEARDRSLAAAVAPPHGLTLTAVAYGASWADAPLRPERQEPG